MRLTMKWDVTVFLLSSYYFIISYDESPHSHLQRTAGHYLTFSCSFLFSAIDLPILTALRPNMSLGLNSRLQTSCRKAGPSSARHQHLIMPGEFMSRRKTKEVRSESQRSGLPRERIRLREGTGKKTKSALWNQSHLLGTTHLVILIKVLCAYCTGLIRRVKIEQSDLAGLMRESKFNSQEVIKVSL